MSNLHATLRTLGRFCRCDRHDQHGGNRHVSENAFYDVQEQDKPPRRCAPSRRWPTRCAVSLPGPPQAGVRLLVVLLGPEQATGPQGADHGREDKDPDGDDARCEHGANHLERLAAKGHAELLRGRDLAGRGPVSCRTRQGGGTRLTRAVLGKTKENHVIWKGILLLFSGLTYFHNDPTETRKNQILKPHSHKPAM